MEGGRGGESVTLGLPGCKSGQIRYGHDVTSSERNRYSRDMLTVVHCVLQVRVLRRGRI